MSSFQKKFGVNFIQTIPPLPGVYRILDAQSNLIYVGKAKNLRRRLSQYRNAKRRKKHRKMRKILEEAAHITFEVCDSERSAEILETTLIQDLRPKWNVVGAFYFLYPMIGINMSETFISFCYTTQPELFPDFLFHGAFRSRDITREAFFSIVKLFRFVGHSIPRSGEKTRVSKYSYVYSFRQIPMEWGSQWKLFFEGQSKSALETLVLALLENAGARKRKGEIQEHLNNISRFWRHEVLPLKKAISCSHYSQYPIAQRDRDLVFIEYRHNLNSNRLSK